MAICFRNINIKDFNVLLRSCNLKSKMEEENGAVCPSVDGDPPLVDEVDDKKTEETKTDSEVTVTTEVNCESVITTDINEATDAESTKTELGSLERLAAAGSDSGVETCGGRGSRSCASSVVSCGSDSSGAGPTRRRRPPAPVVVPRGPPLNTRERARSRDKPTVPEKPRPLTPKPRIRPTVDLPNLVRESPALRAKPTKTSTARCRTPNSPGDDKRWPSSGPRLATVMDTSATRLAADKYGTLPRRRRDADTDTSSRLDTTPPSSRRSTITRSISSRSATKTRVRIYAEKTTQTVLLGTDVETALGGLVPNIESRPAVSKSSRGVQTTARAEGAARLAAADAALVSERARRTAAEDALATERAARGAVLAQLADTTQRLLRLGAEAGAGVDVDDCLKALEEQLRATSELSKKQQTEIEQLRANCDQLQTEVHAARAETRLVEARLSSAEREAAEIQEFLAAETSALNDSLRDNELELVRANQELDKRRAECRQLVRWCEQRRQETLTSHARSLGAAAAALAALEGRLGHLVRGHSDSGSGATPEEERRVWRRDDTDDSAELLDSETEPCLVTENDCQDEWWSGAEGVWSGEELSPVRDEVSVPETSMSERESLRNLSAAITHRQRSEVEDIGGTILDRVMNIDARLTEFLKHVKYVPPSNGEPEFMIRDTIEVPDHNMADVVKKLAELEAGNKMIDQYRQSVDVLKNQLSINEEESLELLEQELSSCPESERRARYETLDGALTALAARPGVLRAWPRLAALHDALERLAFTLAASPTTVDTVRVV